MPTLQKMENIPEIKGFEFETIGLYFKILKKPTQIETYYVRVRREYT